MKRMKKLRQFLAMLLAVMLAVFSPAAALADQSAVGTNLKLTATEGTVSVKNPNGKDMTVLQEMRLFNGYHVATEAASYAWITLDSTKALKLDAVSESEIRQKGKKLEILLNSGNLFFNVTAPLAEDETLNIRTSTMVTGIRGTCGWVKVISDKLTRLFLLEGTVTCWVMDPVSGQRKTITLRGGQVADFIVYEKDKTGDKVDIIVRSFTPDEIEGFVLVELQKDADLRDRILQKSGMDVTEAAVRAQEVLRQEQLMVQQKLAEIQALVDQQAHKVIDPVFKDDTSDGGSGGSSSGSSGGGSGTDDTTNDTTDDTTESDTITLVMPQDDVVVDGYLADYNVILQASGNAAEDTLLVDEGITVPSGKTLTLEDGVSVSVSSGITLQVDDTMSMSDGDLFNEGIINNTSSDTLRVGGTFINQGTINNTGRIVMDSDQTLINNGILESSGSIENSSGAAADIKNTGTLTLNDADVGTLTLTDSEALASITEGSVASLVLERGTFELASGTLGSDVAVGADAVLTVAGGTVGTVTVSDGGTANVSGGTVETVNLNDGGTFNLSGKGTVTTLTQVGGTCNMTGGTVTTATHKNTAADDSVLDTGFYISGGEIGTLTTTTFAGDAATVILSDFGTISSLVMQARGDGYDGRIALEGGNVENVTLAGGRLTLYNVSATIGTLSQTGGYVEVNYGTIQKAVLTKTDSTTTGFKFSVSGGTVESVEVTSPYGDAVADESVMVQIALTGGTVNAMTLNGGAVVLDGAEVGPVTQTGGMFRMYDGTLTGRYTLENNGTYSSGIYLYGGRVERGATVTGSVMCVMDGDAYVTNLDNQNSDSGKAALLINTKASDYGTSLMSGTVDGLMGTAIQIDGSGSYITWNGVTVQGKDPSKAFVAADGSMALINDTLFYSADLKQAVYSCENIGTESSPNYKIKSITAKEEEVSPENYYGPYTYNALMSALYNAKDGDIIALGGDREIGSLGQELVLAGGKEVTLDLCGHDLTLATNTYVDADTDDADNAVPYILNIIDSTGGNGTIIAENIVGGDAAMPPFYCSNSEVHFKDISIKRAAEETGETETVFLEGIDTVVTLENVTAVCEADSGTPFFNFHGGSLTMDDSSLTVNDSVAVDVRKGAELILENGSSISSASSYRTIGVWPEEGQDQPWVPGEIQYNDSVIANTGSGYLLLVDGSYLDQENPVDLAEAGVLPTEVTVNGDSLAFTATLKATTEEKLLGMYSASDEAYVPLSPADYTFEAEVDGETEALTYTGSEDAGGMYVLTPVEAVSAAMLLLEEEPEELAATPSEAEKATPSDAEKEPASGETDETPAEDGENGDSSEDETDIPQEEDAAVPKEDDVLPSESKKEEDSETDAGSSETEDASLGDFSGIENDLSEEGRVDSSEAADETQEDTEVSEGTEAPVDSSVPEQPEEPVVPEGPEESVIPEQPEADDGSETITTEDETKPGTETAVESGIEPETEPEVETEEAAV